MHAFALLMNTAEGARNRLIEPAVAACHLSTSLLPCTDFLLVCVTHIYVCKYTHGNRQLYTDICLKNPWLKSRFMKDFVIWATSGDEENVMDLSSLQICSVSAFGLQGLWSRAGIVRAVNGRLDKDRLLF